MRRKYGFLLFFPFLISGCATNNPQSIEVSREISSTASTALKDESIPDVWKVKYSVCGRNFGKEGDCYSFTDTVWGKPQRIGLYYTKNVVLSDAKEDKLLKSWLQPLAAWPSPKGEQFHAYIAIESQGTLDAMAQPQSKARFFPAALYFAHTGHPDTFFKDSQPNFRLSITSVDEVTNPVLKRSLANQAKVNAQPPGRINRSVEEAEGLTVMLRQLAARPEIEVKPQQVFPVSAGQVVSLQKW